MPKVRALLATVNKKHQECLYQLTTLTTQVAELQLEETSAEQAKSLRENFYILQVKVLKLSESQKKIYEMAGDFQFNAFVTEVLSTASKADQEIHDSFELLEQIKRPELQEQVKAITESVKTHQICLMGIQEKMSMQKTLFLSLKEQDFYANLVGLSTNVSKVSEDLLAILAQIKETKK